MTKEPDPWWFPIRDALVKKIVKVIETEETKKPLVVETTAEDVPQLKKLPAGKKP